MKSRGIESTVDLNRGINVSAVLALFPLGGIFWQSHTDSSCGQTNFLFFVHRHSWIVSFQQCRIHSLCLCILNELLSFLEMGGRSGSGRHGLANSTLDWGRAGKWTARKFTKDGTVD